MSRTRVRDLPHDKQASLVLHRVLTRIEARRDQLERDRIWRPETAPEFYRGWPMSLPNPRWVVESYVTESARRTRVFRLDDGEVAQLVDAVLVALALDAP